MIYLIICLIIKENKRYIMINTKESIMMEFNEFSNCIKIDNLVNDVIRLYRLIPHSLLPINYEYHEDVFEELKNNEYFKDRWWEFENFYNDNKEYNVPVINFEDVMKIYEKVIFIDLRPIQEYENIKVKDSLFFSLEKNKYFDNTINTIEKNKGSKFFVILNNKGGRYKESVMYLLNKKINLICILQGGIDVIFLEEPNLIVTKK
jgi:hypothetical protein